MCMKSHRLQVLIEPEEHTRLAALAARQGVSVAEVVRRAIDTAITPADRITSLAALIELLRAPAVPMPAEVADLEREIDELMSS